MNISELHENIRTKRILQGVSKSNFISQSIIFQLRTEHMRNPSPNGNRLVVAASDEESGKVFMWDIENGKLIHSFPSHKSPVFSLKHFADDSVEFFASLSESQLQVYKLFNE